MRERYAKPFQGLLVAVLAAFTTTSAVAPAAAQTVEPISLKAASYFPPPSGQSKLVESFTKEIENRTSGRVRFTYYPGGTLLGPDKLYEGLVSGLVDVVMAGLHFTPGRFPVMSTLYTPMGYPSAWVATHVVNDFYSQYKPQELATVQPLFLHATAPLLYFTKKRVSSLEDLKGLIIRSTDLNNPVVTSLGAVPRNMAIPEAVEGASRGLLDGFLLPPEAILVWRIGNVMKFATLSLTVSSADSFVVAMNKNVWNKLPSDIQNIIAQVSREYIEVAAMMWENINKRGYQAGKDTGMQFIALSGSEAAKWEAAVQSVFQSYVEKQASSGLSREEANSRLAYIKAQIKSWRSEQVKRGMEILGSQ